MATQAMTPIETDDDEQQREVQALRRQVIEQMRPQERLIEETSPREAVGLVRLAVVDGDRSIWDSTCYSGLGRCYAGGTPQVYGFLLTWLERRSGVDV